MTIRNLVRSGFYLDSVNGTEYPREVMMADKSIGRPTKAKDADVVMYTQSTFSEYPDSFIFRARTLLT